MVAGGRDPGTPVAVISEGSMPTERRLFTDLGSLGTSIAEVRPPAIIVIGDVVGLVDQGGSNG